MQNQTVKFTVLTIVLILAFLIIVPVFGQDATAEPAASVTAEPVPSNVSVNIDKETTPPGSVTVSLLAILAIIITSLAGGLALPRIIDRIRTDPAAIEFIEGRADTLPEETTSAIGKVAGVLESAAKLIEEAVDRIPAAEKPPAIKLFSDDELKVEMEYRGYVVTRPSALNDIRPIT